MGFSQSVGDWAVLQSSITEQYYLSIMSVGIMETAETAGVAEESLKQLTTTDQSNRQ